jgi:hypothetical protein
VSFVHGLELLVAHALPTVQLFFLFFLFIDAVSNSELTASDLMMIWEYWTETNTHVAGFILI